MLAVPAARGVGGVATRRGGGRLISARLDRTRPVEVGGGVRGGPQRPAWRLVSVRVESEGP